MNVQQLMDAVSALDAHDSLPCKLTLEEWKKLAPYLAIRFLNTSDVLIREGESERVLYILAEGGLEVKIQDSVLVTLKPGSLVGEGTFFSGEPRSATVVASSPGVAWALSWDKFETMCHRQPRLAIDLTKGLAAVLAIRMRQAILVGHFA